MCSMEPKIYGWKAERNLSWTEEMCWSISNASASVDQMCTTTATSRLVLLYPKNPSFSDTSLQARW